MRTSPALRGRDLAREIRFDDADDAAHGSVRPDRTPAILDDPCGHARRDVELGHVFPDDRPGADDHVTADAHPVGDDDVRAQPHAIADITARASAPDRGWECRRGCR